MDKGTQGPSLSDATCQALQACGTRLLEEPKVLYGTLSDLMPSMSPELRVLRSVLADSEDAKALEPLTRLNGASSASDVEAAARRIQGWLTGERMLAEGVSASVAEGLAEGTARYYGIVLPSGGLSSARTAAAAAVLAAAQAKVASTATPAPKPTPAPAPKPTTAQKTASAATPKTTPRPAATPKATPASTPKPAATPKAAPKSTPKATPASTPKPASKSTPKSASKPAPTPSGVMGPILAVGLFVIWILLIEFFGDSADGFLPRLEAQGIPRWVTLLSSLVAFFLVAVLIDKSHETAGCFLMIVACIASVTLTALALYYVGERLGVTDNSLFIVASVLLSFVAPYLLSKVFFGSDKK